MAFDVKKPADTQTIAAGPAEIRENLRALKDDKIVNAQKVMDLSPGNASGNLPVANGNLCVNLNAEKLGGSLASAFATANHTHGAVTTSSNGLMSNTDKAKLDGIAAGAEVNQNAFANIRVGTTTIAADGKTDTLEFAAGTNISITPDATNDRVTIAVTGTVASAATCTGNAATATTAATCTGNAATATKLATARTINGVIFDGSGDITVTAAANGGTSAACSGNAATATKLATARTVALTGVVTGSGSFDGSGNLSIATSTTLGSVPTGAIFYFPSTTPPSGYLELNGALLSRTTYATLWAYAQASGNLAASDSIWQAGKFSPGDGSTTFRIPDLRSEFIRGWDHGRGVDASRAIGSWQNHEVISHAHSIQGIQSATSGTGWHAGYEWSNLEDWRTALSSSGSAGGTETRPRNVALMYCIKY
jgi:phage-related tail fiber protein